MHYELTITSPIEQDYDCLILPVLKDMRLSAQAQSLDQTHGEFISKWLAQGDLKPEIGQTLLLHHAVSPKIKRILCVYCGDPAAFKELQFQKVVSSIMTVLQKNSILKACCYVEEFPPNTCGLAWKIRQLVERCEASTYRFDLYKSKKENPSPAKSLQSFSFYITDRTQEAEAETAILQAKAIAAGMRLKKDLANHPANHCTPSDVAQAAQTLADQYHLKIEILDQDHPEVAKMGAFLSVARGSEEPPKFVVIHYAPESAKEVAPVVLVGKGVTFDSGGISIKPSAKMDEMKFDMAGAASVLGTLKAVAELKLSIPVIGILPLTENLPSGRATKPGDVVTTLSGQTVEILNTDAEGRLILADALTYSERFNPSVVIDIATLTGAIVVALGPVATGLMSNDSDLVSALEAAGQESFDRVWRLPLWDDYQEFINGNVADISNIGDGSGAGSITAGCFLARFTRKKPFQWAHLDIAGTAWKSGGGKVAATGRPVPLLVQYLIDRSQKSF